jgi:L-rhamnose-H+ transport protein
MTSLFAGLCLAVLGGTLTGSFTAPMKFIHRWTWENTWFVYSIVGFLIIPIAMASLSVPHLIEVYHAANPRAVALAVLFGFGWGVGSVLFGLGVTMLGMALGFAVILGLTAAAGSLIPLIVLSPEAFPTARGAAIVLGLAIVVCGIVVCARAGGLKNQSEASTLDRQHYRKGLLICISSGVVTLDVTKQLRKSHMICEDPAG